VNQTNDWSGAGKLLAIFTLLMVITLYLPGFGLLLSLFLVAPVIIFTVKKDMKLAMSFLFICILLSILVGGTLGLQLAVQYGVTGFTLGYCIKRQQTRLFTYFLGTVSFCVALVINYVTIIYLFNINLINNLMEQLSISMEQANQMYLELGLIVNPIDIDGLVEMFTILTPTMFLITSAFIVFLLEVVNYPFVRKSLINVPKWLNFSTFMLPKILFWYYLIVMLLAIIIPMQPGEMLYSVISNFELVLQLLFYLQGISFICFYAKQKNWNIIIPIIITIFSLLLPILMYLIRLLGIIDLGFELRKLFIGKNKR